MTSTLPKWKEAASLIMVASTKLARSVAAASPAVTMDSVESSSTDCSPLDYRVLMAKRSEKSSFFASSYVFPGGQVEIADFSPHWWSVFDNFSQSREKLNLFSRMVTGPRPPIVTNPITLNDGANTSDHLPSDIALRISAIRETFEETGILVVKSKSPFHSQVASDDHMLWRKKVRKDASSFLDFCLESQVCPDIWSLFEWSNWLTPPLTNKKRYDTMFYVACLEQEPKVMLFDKELTESNWFTPSDALEANVQGLLQLPPPQIYELERFDKLKSFQELKSFCEQRQVKGCRQWLPVVLKATDGMLSLLPGDDLYLDYLNCSEEAKTLTESLDDLRARCRSLNRVELKKGVRFAICNNHSDCEHITV